MKRLRPGEIVFAVIILLVTATLIWRMTPRGVNLSARTVHGRTEFRFSMHRINGLLHLSLWRADTREPLWMVSLNYYREPRLVYGDIPNSFLSFNGVSQSARQVFPAGGKKPFPLPPSCKLYMALVLQYDDFFDPMTSTRHFSLMTDAAGQVVSVSDPIPVGPQEYPLIK